MGPVKYKLTYQLNVPTRRVRKIGETGPYSIKARVPCSVTVDVTVDFDGLAFVAWRAAASKRKVSQLADGAIVFKLVGVQETGEPVIPEGYELISEEELKAAEKPRELDKWKRIQLASLDIESVGVEGLMSRFMEWELKVIARKRGLKDGGSKRKVAERIYEQAETAELLRRLRKESERDG